MGTLSSEQIKVFLTVVEQGSFSAAARVLRRKQSAVSYAISNLEVQLGISLFDRTGSRPRLTQAGMSLLPDARKMAYNLETLRARARGFSRGEEAELDIVVDAFCPLAELESVLQAFAEEFPLVKPTLHLETGGRAVERMLAGSSTLGLISHPIATHEELELSYTDITFEMAPYAAASHGLVTAGRRITSEDLVKSVQVILPRPAGLGPGGNFGVLSSRLWLCEDLRMQQMLLRAGIGWGFMPTHFVAGDLSVGHLARLDLAASPRVSSMRLPLMAVWHADSTPGPAASWLITHLSGQNSTGPKAR